MLRPLDRIPSIKVKLSVVIVAAVAIGAVVSLVGFRAGVPLWLRPPIAAAIALLLVYPFSRGLTAPLREMVRASRAMAEGDFDVPVTTTSHDEVGELARAFVTTRSQLAEVDRQRRDFIANASHELRTPIASLRATLENLVDGVGDPDPGQLTMLLNQTERLGVLVERLLDLSRLEAGTMVLHIEDVDLRQLLEQSAVETRVQWPDIDIDVATPGAVPWRGDRTRLRQVIDNLVHNAARHAPHGTRVRLDARATDHAVTVTVADEGSGIPPEERPLVFERFYRADRGRSSDLGGAGLGLAIAQWIVGLHGGRVRIEDNVPRGCRMVVELPLGGADV